MHRRIRPVPGWKVETGGGAPTRHQYLKMAVNLGRYVDRTAVPVGFGLRARRLRGERATLPEGVADPFVTLRG